MPSSLRVVLADDHLIVRQGLKALLDAAEGISVVAEGCDGFEAVEAVERTQPDIALLDLSMPGPGLVETIQLVKKGAPRCRVVILSIHATAEFVRMALRAGVEGYLVKGAGIGELCRALREVSQGRRWFSPQIEEAVLEEQLCRPGAKEPVSPLDRLSDRELEVIELIVEGNSSRGIAQLLGLSVKTVGWYRERIMAKFSLHDVTALTRFAVRHGLVKP